MVDGSPVAAMTTVPQSLQVDADRGSRPVQAARGKARRER
jgi:hypothetical protein